MSAPDLVVVIAAAMWNGRYSDDPWEGIDPEDCDREQYIDDARAVLAALTEAGTVEWGVRYGDGSPLQRCHTEEWSETCAADNQDGGPTVVSRLTLPWTAAES